MTVFLNEPELKEVKMKPIATVYIYQNSNGELDASLRPLPESPPSYLLNLFEDDVQLIPLAKGGTVSVKAEKNPDVCSDRISQTLEVLSFIKQNRALLPADEILAMAVTDVAETRGISRSAVLDKICRKTGVLIDSWQQWVERWLATGDFSEIEAHLLNHLPQRTKYADEKVLKEFAANAKF